MHENIHEKPIPPNELLFYQILQKRKHLTNEEQKKFHNAKIGLEGEFDFFEFLQSTLPSEKLLLHSLQLSYNHSEFQIDSLLIWEQTIYLFEVKNFSGDFYIQNKNWYVSPSNKEINNPLIQLSRAESLLRQLIGSLGFQFDIQSYLVFINPEFALFQAPLQLPIILRAQLNRFFKKMIRNTSGPQNDVHNLAKALTDCHLEKSSYEQLPKYAYGELKKGIFCPKCVGKMSRSNRNNFICHICKTTESCGTAIIRSSKELKTLFPTIKVTNQIVHDWIDRQVSRKTIWENLKKIE